jgi:hypothetical protein
MDLRRGATERESEGWEEPPETTPAAVADLYGGGEGGGRAGGVAFGTAGAEEEPKAPLEGVAVARFEGGPSLCSLGSRRLSVDGEEPGGRRHRGGWGGAGLLGCCRWRTGLNSGWLAANGVDPKEAGIVKRRPAGIEVVPWWLGAPGGFRKCSSGGGVGDLWQAGAICQLWERVWRVCGCGYHFSLPASKYPLGLGSRRTRGQRFRPISAPVAIFRWGSIAPLFSAS